MFIRNHEVAFNKEEVFYCKSPNLLKFLTEIYKIQYINKILNKDNKFTWVFFRSPDLDKALNEWSNNKKNNTFLYK
jgi:hypothetical protein